MSSESFAEAMSERELEEIENEISAVVKAAQENEEAEFRTQVIGEFALNLIEDFRRSQSEASKLQERVEKLSAAAMFYGNARNYHWTGAYESEVVSDGGEIARAALSPKQENQEEEE